jgi:hypothetical protein
MGMSVLHFIHQFYYVVEQTLYKDEAHENKNMIYATNKHGNLQATGVSPDMHDMGTHDIYCFSVWC